MNEELKIKNEELREDVAGVVDTTTLATFAVIPRRVHYICAV